MFESKIYNVGIYIRLSREDEDKRKLESESITNQRNLILNYINKADDNFKIYNEYVDKLINRHIENILFEFNNPIPKKKPTNSKKQKAKPNKWIKAETNDLFTGQIRYIYENLKTGEIITSGNPNLLEELNTKKQKKEKIQQPKVISTEGLIFNFKKKI